MVWNIFYFSIPNWLSYFLEGLSHHQPVYGIFIHRNYHTFMMFGVWFLYAMEQMGYLISGDGRPLEEPFGPGSSRANLRDAAWWHVWETHGKTTRPHYAWLGLVASCSKWFAFFLGWKQIDTSTGGSEGGWPFAKQLILVQRSSLAKIFRFINFRCWNEWAIFVWSLGTTTMTPPKVLRVQIGCSLHRCLGFRFLFHWLTTGGALFEAACWEVGKVCLWAILF